jgi:hypothetical protein
VRRIRTLERNGLVPGPEYNRLTHAPGIRYFADRPVLRPPAPTAGISGGRTKTFVEFYDRLEREEPDRIVRHPLNAEAR